MIRGFSRTSSLSSRLLSVVSAPSIFLIAFLICSPVQTQASGRISGTTYHDRAGQADYRQVSTLNDFTRLVYKDRWLDIRAEHVMEQMARFQGAALSPALRDSWRDVLLGDFVGLNIRNADQQTMLMAERLRLLNRLGFFHEAVRLYNEAAKHKPVPAVIAAQGVEAMALSGSADGACLEVYMAAEFLKADEWQKDKTLCAVYFGDTELAGKMYSQIKAEPGSGFNTVYQMLTKKTEKAINVGIPSLWRTLLLARGATITQEAMAQADPMTLASLANNKRVPLATRLAAADRAAERGTVDYDLLRKLYETKHPTNTGLESIISDAKDGRKDLPQADYYAAARFIFNANDRARIVKNAYHALTPTTNVKSHVFSWITDKLTLQVKKLGWFAPEGYAILTTTNRLPSATLYYNQGNMDNSRYAVINALLQGNPWPQTKRTLWEDAMKATYKKEADEKITDIMKLVVAYDMEKKLALDVESTERYKPTTKQSILRDSVRRGGRGLTLVTALNHVAQANEIKAIPFDQFIDIIDIMTKEGLFRERKKLALEFLIQIML